MFLYKPRIATTGRLNNAASDVVRNVVSCVAFCFWSLGVASGSGTGGDIVKDGGASLIVDKMNDPPMNDIEKRLNRKDEVDFG